MASTREITLEFFRDMETGRRDLALARLAENVIYDIVAPPPLGGSYGLADLLETSGRWMRPMFAGPLTFEMIDCVVDGDRAAVQAQSSCLLIDGTIYANQYLFLFVIRADRIIEVREYFDTGYLDETMARLERRGSFGTTV